MRVAWLTISEIYNATTNIHNTKVGASQHVPQWYLSIHLLPAHVVVDYTHLNYLSSHGSLRWMFMHYPFNAFAEWGEVQRHINVPTPIRPLVETRLAIILLVACRGYASDTYISIHSVFFNFRWFGYWNKIKFPNLPGEKYIEWVCLCLTRRPGRR